MDFVERLLALQAKFTLQKFSVTTGVLDTQSVGTRSGGYKLTYICGSRASVFVTTLKKLTFYSGQKSYSSNNFLFDIPNLVYLDYIEVIADKYPKVNFD